MLPTELRHLLRRATLFWSTVLALQMAFTVNMSEAKRSSEGERAVQGALDQGMLDAASIASRHQKVEVLSSGAESEDSGIEDMSSAMVQEKLEKPEAENVAVMVLNEQHKRIISLLVITVALAYLAMPAWYLHKMSMETQIGAVASLLYLLTKVTVDILSYSGTGLAEFPFDPARVIILVESGRFLLSMVLFLASKTQSVMPWQSMCEDVQKFTVYDLFLLAYPALLFSVNNIVFYPMLFDAGCETCPDMSTYGAFGQTLILWTGIIWTWTFQISLGQQRIQALFLLMMGSFLGQAAPLMGAAFHLRPILQLSLMSLLNAAGIVGFEFVVKRQPTLDFNLQSMVLYFWFCTAGFLQLVVLESQKPASIFEGFTMHPIIAAIVILEIFAGLFLAGSIKYANSVINAVVISLRGPVFLFVAPLLDLPSDWDSSLVVISAVTVGSSALYFLQQGTPGALKVPQVDQVTETAY